MFDEEYLNTLLNNATQALTAVKSSNSNTSNTSDKIIIKSTEKSSSKLSDIKLTSGYSNLSVIQKSTTGPIILHKDYTEISNAVETHINNYPQIQPHADKKSPPTDTAGPKWFDMPAPIMTDELKKDINVLKSRGVLDPKRHYKKQTQQELKYFQMGTIIEGPSEFYSSRLKRKDRKDLIVEELMADTESRQYLKKKYLEVQERNSKFTRRRGGFARNGRKGETMIVPSTEVNPNSTWLNLRGSWITTFFVLFTLRIILAIVPGISSETSWTLTNLLYNLITFIMFHGVMGVPFGLNQNELQGLTLWEQIDNGAHFTPAKKFLTAVPIFLFLLSTHFTHYDTFTFVINLTSLIVVLVAKLPIMHLFRVFKDE